jgi:hypothetical protein
VVSNVYRCTAATSRHKSYVFSNDTRWHSTRALREICSEIIWFHDTLIQHREQQFQWNATVKSKQIMQCKRCGTAMKGEKDQGPNL